MVIAGLQGTLLKTQMAAFASQVRSNGGRPVHIAPPSTERE